MRIKCMNGICFRTNATGKRRLAPGERRTSQKQLLHITWLLYKFDKLICPLLYLFNYRLSVFIKLCNIVMVLKS